MLKFRGEYDQHSAPDHRDGMNEKMAYLSAYMIPTVDEVNEILAPMAADTVLQILHGQGYYYGYEIERDVDNEIRDLSRTLIVIERQERYRLWVRQQKKEQRRQKRAFIELRKQQRREANKDKLQRMGLSGLQKRIVRILIYRGLSRDAAIARVIQFGNVI
jgi:hypothetical protein